MPLRDAFELADCIAFSLSIRHEIVTPQRESAMLSALRRKHSDTIPHPDRVLTSPRIDARRWLHPTTVEARPGLVLPSGAIATRVGTSARGDHFAILTAFAVGCIHDRVHDTARREDDRPTASDLHLDATIRMLDEEERIVEMLLDPKLRRLLMPEGCDIRDMKPGHVLLQSPALIAMAARSLKVIGSREFDRFVEQQTAFPDHVIDRLSTPYATRGMLRNTRRTVAPQSQPSA